NTGNRRRSRKRRSAPSPAVGIGSRGDLRWRRGDIANGPCRKGRNGIILTGREGGQRGDGRRRPLPMNRSGRKTSLTGPPFQTEGRRAGRALPGKVFPAPNRFPPILPRPSLLRT